MLLQIFHYILFMEMSITKTENVFMRRYTSNISSKASIFNKAMPITYSYHSHASSFSSLTSGTSDEDRAPSVPLQHIYKLYSLSYHEYGNIMYRVGGTC
jgi:hypothetical protein